MSLYLIKSDVLTGETGADCTTDWCRLLNKIAPSGVIEVGLEQEQEIQHGIADDDVVRIVKMRSPLFFEETAPTLARGEADFMSFAMLNQFFEQAVRRSASVCQLLKKCSDDDVDSCIDLVRRETYTLRQLRELIRDARMKDTFWSNFSSTLDESDLAKLKSEMSQKSAEGFYIPMGTGFLVGRSYLLTNNHVLDSKSAENFVARFRYDRNDNLDSDRLDFPPVDYELDPSAVVSSPPDKLDYTLIKTKPLAEIDTERGLNFLDAGDNFGWLPLFEDDALVTPPASKELIKADARLSKEMKAAALFGLPGEPVNIIQHPRGRAKEIVFYSNRVQQISENYIQYEADTDFGSSGSPVLNRQWQAVALHHAVMVEENEGGINVRGSLGIRTCAIAQHIKTRHGTKPGISSFIENFIIPKDKYTKPRGTIYILAQIFGADHSLEIDDENKKETVATFAGRLKLIVDGIKKAKVLSDFGTLLDLGYEVELIPASINESKSDGKIVFDWLSLEPPKFKVGDIALYITMDAYIAKDDTDATSPNASETPAKKVVKDNPLRGISVFYAGHRAERQAQAQLFLQRLLNQEVDQKNLEPSDSVYKQTISLLMPNRGVRSDLTFIEEPKSDEEKKDLSDEEKKLLQKQLPFTRSLGIPSLILRLGFLTNQSDRDAIEVHQDAISQGIAEALLVWGNSINPVPMEVYRPTATQSVDQSAEAGDSAPRYYKLPQTPNSSFRFSF